MKTYFLCVIYILVTFLVYNLILELISMPSNIANLSAVTLTAIYLPVSYKVIKIIIKQNKK